MRQPWCGRRFQPPDADRRCPTELQRTSLNGTAICAHSRDPGIPFVDSVATTTSVLATRGASPLQGVGLMPGTVGRSPGSRVVVLDKHRRIFLAFPEVDATRKGGRFVDDRGVRPRLIAQPSSGFSGSGLALDRPHHANRHPWSRSVSNGRSSPLYSRGVGCDWRSRSGSPPSHSLLLSEPPLGRSETIRSI